MFAPLRSQDAWVFMSIRDGPTPFAKTVPEAAVLGLRAGLDQEGGGSACVQTLPDLVKNGAPSFPRPIPPSFPVLARACLWCLGARM